MTILCFYQLLNIEGVITHILFNMTRSEEAVQNRSQLFKSWPLA